MLNLDDELIKRLLKKDADAFNRFYNQSVDIFFRYARSRYTISEADTNDLLSTFYFKLWNGIGTYKEGNSFEAWVWTIFKNIIKDFFKKSKELSFSSIYKSDEENDYEDELASDENIAELFNRDFEYSNIQTAIKKLDESSQDIIFLKFVEERNHEEISQILGISNDNVRQKLSRAIKKLKELLK